MFRNIYDISVSLKNSSNPFEQSVGHVFRQENSFEEAIVIDVIVNETHPDYTPDGYNVGVVKCRPIKSSWFKEDVELHYAFPLDSNISSYPLLNEVVIVFISLGRLYYSRIVNVTNRVTSQPVFGLKEELGSGPSINTTQDYYQTQGAAKKSLFDNSQNNTLGNIFVDNGSIARLRHNEGDIVIEGRSGHSIRFGSDPTTNQSPTILLRTGQSPEAVKTVQSPFGLVSEDINGDLSSLWMVTDSNVPIKLSTVGNPVHFKSVTNPPSSFGGNQIVINSDRIILNTKQDRIYMNSFNGIHLTSLQDVTIDAAENYISFIEGNNEITIQSDEIKVVSGSIKITSNGDITEDASGNYSIIGSKVHVGSVSDESEPMVLGETLRELLLSFINAHLNNQAAYVMTPTGTGQLMPSVIAELTNIQTELEKGSTTDILSQDNFVSRNNS